MLPTLMLALATTSAAGAAELPALEVSTGVGSLLVLSPVSGSFGLAAEIAADGPISESLRWTGGARLGLAHASPELFGRVSLSSVLSWWAPTLGLELGLSAAGDDDRSEIRAIEETRASARTELIPLYAGLSSRPLRFHVSERLRLSVLELHVGTYLHPLGRYVRLQVGFLSAGYAW